MTVTSTPCCTQRTQCSNVRLASALTSGGKLAGMNSTFIGSKSGPYNGVLSDTRGGSSLDSASLQVTSKPRVLISLHGSFKPWEKYVQAIMSSVLTAQRARTRFGSEHRADFHNIAVGVPKFIDWYRGYYSR